MEEQVRVSGPLALSEAVLEEPVEPLGPVVIDVLDAQVNLTTARSSLVQAQYQYKIALASLERAIGGPLNQ